MSIIDSLISVLVPHDCLGCSKEGALLCPGCIAALPATSPPQAAGLSTGRAVTAYNGLAKDLIWRLKSSGAQAAAKIMAQCMSQLVRAEPGMLLVPVPTATKRVRARGYDQSEILARALARKTGLPCCDCLARLGQTHQVGASRTQRLRQLRAAFRVTKPEQIRQRHIVLVDDVTTTGATLEIAAQTLLAAGAARVEAITFAYAEKFK